MQYVLPVCEKVLVVICLPEAAFQEVWRPPWTLRDLSFTDSASWERCRWEQESKVSTETMRWFIILNSGSVSNLKLGRIVKVRVFFGFSMYLIFNIIGTLQSCQFLPSIKVSRQWSVIVLLSLVDVNRPCVSIYRSCPTTFAKLPHDTYSLRTVSR